MITLPKTEHGSRIGILGGSFDPPHLGHQLLAVCALALEPIDQFWVMPCADHPFSKKLSSFEHRMHMAKLAFAAFDSRVKIIGIENELEGPSYSVKTLEAIRNKEPSLELNLVMGSDVYEDLTRWKNPEQLAKLSRIIVFLRENSPLKEGGAIPAKIHRQFVLPHIKSTVIREMFQNSDAEPSFLDRRVLDYVRKNGLYRKI